MFSWAILAAMMIGVAAIIAAAQPQPGSIPPAPVADALARECLAVFQDGAGQVGLPDGVTIQRAATQCTVNAPYGVLTVGALADSGNLIGGGWSVLSQDGQYVLRAQIQM